MFLEAEPRETLSFLGKKINCFPRYQRLSVYNDGLVGNL